MPVKTVAHYIPYPKEPVYKPSLVGRLLFTDIDGMTKCHSDVNLILRDKSLADKLGPDNLRSFLDSLLRERDAGSSDALSDDELMDTIVSRRITEATDVYSMAKLMEKEYDSFKTQIDKNKALKEKTESERKKLLDALGVKSAGSGD